MNNTTTRKRLYRVETADRILSEHRSHRLALIALEVFEDHAARGLTGLTPDALLTVTRWNGQGFVAMNDLVPAAKAVR